MEVDVLGCMNNTDLKKKVNDNFVHGELRYVVLEENGEDKMISKVTNEVLERRDAIWQRVVEI